MSVLGVQFYQVDFLKKCDLYSRVIIVQKMWYMNIYSE